MMSVFSHILSPTGGCSDCQEVNFVDTPELHFLYNHEVMNFKESKKQA